MHLRVLRRECAGSHSSDLDLPPRGPHDQRRLEVVADGLPLFHGAQLAIDTTKVSPVSGDGRPGPQRVDGAALVRARRRKETTYPELSDSYFRARLVVLAREVGGRWSGARTFLSQLKAKVRHEQPAIRASARHAWLRRWVPFWLVARPGPWPCRWWNTEEVLVLTVPLLQILRCWLTAGIARSVICVSFVSLSIVSKKEKLRTSKPQQLRFESKLSERTTL